MEVAGAERTAAVRGRAAHPTVVEHEPVRQVAARLLRKLACGRRTPLGGSVEFRVACSLIRKEAPPALSTLERLHAQSMHLCFLAPVVRYNPCYRSRTPALRARRAGPRAQAEVHAWTTSTTQAASLADGSTSHRARPPMPLPPLLARQALLRPHRSLQERATAQPQHRRTHQASAPLRLRLR